MGLYNDVCVCGSLFNTPCKLHTTYDWYESEDEYEIETSDFDEEE